MSAAIPMHQLPYADQLEEKVALTAQEFSSFGVREMDVVASPDSGFRMRAEFRAWHDDNKVRYAMFEPGVKKLPYVIDSFPIGSRSMQTAMTKVLHHLNDTPPLRERLFQIEFLTSTLGEVLVTLIYRRRLDELWQAAATIMSQELGVYLIGRSRKQKIIIGRDYIHEQFCVGEKVFKYKQVEGAFSQPNAYICEKMLGWVTEQIRGDNSDLLELYCGNGNFTLPLSTRFKRVLATEISKTSLNAAIDNCTLNDISNITFARLSSEELTQALNNVREFNRLKGIPLDDYRFSTVFVDPPRAGLDDQTLALLRRYRNIVYVSCNPTTLKPNLASLQGSHRVRRMALFDQFPHTHHREIAVVLEAQN